MQDANIRNGSFISRTFHAWRYALIPSLKSHRRLLSLFDEKLRRKTIFSSIAIAASIISILVHIDVLIVTPGVLRTPISALVLVVSMALAALITGGIIFVYIRLLAGGSQWIARRLDGNGAFASLNFVYSTYITPGLLIIILVFTVMTILNRLAGVPAPGVFPIIMLLYLVVLSVFANRVVHDLGWYDAALASIPMLVNALIYFLIDSFVVNLI